MISVLDLQKKHLSRDLVSFKPSVVQKDRFSKISTIQIGKTMENDERP